MSKKPEPPTFVGDDHWGKGGRYVVIAGKRVPAEEAPEAPEAPEPSEPATPAPPQPTPAPEQKGN